MATSDEQVEKEYADFEARVSRTIYIDHLSPLVTNQVIKAALSQCANVVSSEFIVNYTIPYDIPVAALVELEDESQAQSVVDLMHDFPFIIGGMPRPVRATHAKPEMFQDRPSRPGLKMEICWVKEGDPEYDGMNKLKRLAKRQDAENMALVKNQLEEEAELATQQQVSLDENYKKYKFLRKWCEMGRSRTSLAVTRSTCPVTDQFRQYKKLPWRLQSQCKITFFWLWGSPLIKKSDRDNPLTSLMQPQSTCVQLHPLCKK